MSIFDTLEKPKLIHIYGLIDPRETKKKIYIGATVNLKRRYGSHITSGKYLYEKKIKDLWINGLVNIELKPYLLLLEKAYMLNFEIWQFERVWERVADENGYEIQNENFNHWENIQLSDLRKISDYKIHYPIE